MADVYDFRTGRLCKRCELCRMWKDAKFAFPDGYGKYDKSDVCCKCLGIKDLDENDCTNPEAPDAA